MVGEIFFHFQISLVDSFKNNSKNEGQNVSIFLVRYNRFLYAVLFFYVKKVP